MFGPKAFLLQTKDRLHGALIQSAAELECYVKDNPNSPVTKRATELASLCSDCQSVAQLNQLCQYLSPAGHESYKPADWAALFTAAAEKIGPEPKEEEDRALHMGDKEKPVRKKGNGKAGLRAVLKQDSDRLNQLIHHNSKVQWPGELSATIARLQVTAAVIYRLWIMAKQWRQVLVKAAKFASFLDENNV